LNSAASWPNTARKLQPKPSRDPWLAISGSSLQSESRSSVVWARIFRRVAFPSNTNEEIEEIWNLVPNGSPMEIRAQ
jgi:hypothetical protein